MKKLNIGCGKKILPEYINLDVVMLPGVDVVHDLNVYPYPFDEESFDYIFADNVIEHLDDTIACMEEIWRLLKPGGSFSGVVPYYTSVSAYSDPTHKQFFTRYTFEYFTETSEYNFYTKVRFEIVERRLQFSKRLRLFEKLFNRFPKIYHGLFARIIPADGLRFELKKLKI